MRSWVLAGSRGVHVSPPREFRLTVNGEPRVISAAAERSLLSVVRGELGLTGAKYGCGEGECGSCTLLLAGHPVRSCQVKLGEVGTREVTTVEGLAREGCLTVVQRAFLEAGAFQCGFCTPGFIVGVTALLRENPSPTPTEVREALDGHLCRCGGYLAILSAVDLAAKRPAESGGSA